MSKLRTAKSVVDEVTGFVAGLDRSPLGSFAIDEKTLIGFGIVLAARIAVFERPPNSNPDTKNWKDLAELVNTNRGHSAASGEWIFWLDRAGLYKGNMPSYRTDVRDLKTVFAYPDFHDYFRAGFWDIPTIEGFVKNGIDASLAKSLVAA